MSDGSMKFDCHVQSGPHRKNHVANLSRATGYFVSAEIFSCSLKNSTRSRAMRRQVFSYSLLVMCVEASQLLRQSSYHVSMRSRRFWSYCSAVLECGESGCADCASGWALAPFQARSNAIVQTVGNVRMAHTSIRRAGQEAGPHEFVTQLRELGVLRHLRSRRRGEKPKMGCGPGLATCLRELMAAKT
jgi:hypothetical protein